MCPGPEVWKLSCPRALGVRTAGVTWVLAFVVLPHPFTSSVHWLGLAGLGNSNAQMGRGGQTGLIRGVHQGDGTRCMARGKSIRTVGGVGGMKWVFCPPPTRCGKALRTTHPRDSGYTHEGRAEALPPRVRTPQAVLRGGGHTGRGAGSPTCEA